MTSEEYNYTIRLVQDRHYFLKLTFKQAEKVFRFEQQRDAPSGEHTFSQWEEYDYMLDNFQKILDEKQLKKFLTWHRKKIKDYESFLIESDRKQTKNIKYYTGLIRYFQERFLPAFEKENFALHVSSLSEEWTKVEYLRAEYKKFLVHLKAGQIIGHYRHSRLFQPNTLKAALLRNKYYHIIPQFPYFKGKMDEPTKVMASFLLRKFDHIPEEHAQFFNHQAESLESFTKELQSKYFGTSKGWITIKGSTGNIKENQIMQMVLMDKGMYGWKETDF
ncbi:MAG: hypothetical protein C5B59_10550 [Bacteroidetes bacterium]|nr:MAG: hypothetical protein C5B59_10550 [Bacteroidota bacterium]